MHGSRHLALLKMRLLTLFATQVDHSGLRRRMARCVRTKTALERCWRSWEILGKSQMLGVSATVFTVIRCNVQLSMHLHLLLSALCLHFR